MKPRKKQMKTPHKHAEVIKAWADGAEVEVKHSPGCEWLPTDGTFWWLSSEYHIKPAPKPDIVRYRIASADVYAWAGTKLKHNLKLTFDGETGSLKSAEVL